MSRRVALALSGGAAYGAAHLGVLKALEESDIQVAGIAGTSAGALVGTLHAFGVTVDEMVELAEDLSWGDLGRIHRPRMGLLSVQKLQEWVSERIGEKRLEEAPIPLALVATDLGSGEMVVLEEGDAAFAVAASCAIPGLFTPPERAERLLVDGGLVNNLPVRLARDMEVGPVVASDLLAPGDRPMPKNIFEVLIRAVNLVVGGATSRERGLADVLITPDTGDFDSADLSRSQDLLEEGYRAAMEALKERGWAGPSGGV